MSTLHSTLFLPSFCATSAAHSKLFTNPLSRPRLPSSATCPRRTKLSCSASPNLGLDQRSLEKTDTKLPSEVQTLEDDKSRQGFLFSSHGWAALRVDHDDFDMLQQFSRVQAEAFHVPFAVFDDFFFSIFKGEVLSSLLHKIRHASPKRFACLVAVPDCPQNEQNKVVGVVDAAAMADQHVLRCLPGAVDEYLYLSGMAVDSNYRRQKVATVLLEACDLTAMEWGFEYLVLQAYEDDRAARLLYARAGYTIISMDPLWLSQWLGRRRRLILAKRASLIVT
eukprot:c13028_g1_i2 orf=124-963(+)